MRKNILKRIATAAVTAAMIATSLPVMAFAADEVSTVDTTKPVSLTLTKYVAGEDDSTELEDDVTGTQQNVTGHEPMKDVGFTVLKFATMVQENDGSQVRLLYSLTEDGAAILMKAKGLGVLDTDRTFSANDKVDIDALKKFVTGKTARGPVFTGIENMTNAVTAVTGADGVVKFTSAAVTESTSVKHINGQGLYLVVETKAPDKVTQRTRPFFVALPMSDRINLNQWMYDVYAYPKNMTGTIDIDKQIASVNGNSAQGHGNIAEDSHSAEANIGDTITYSVSFTMPIPDGGLKKLGIVDTMCPGLTFKKAGTTAASTDVKVFRTDDNDRVVPSTNYTVESKVNDDGTTTLNVLFTSTYLTQLNTSTNKLPEFEIRYDAVLNEKAVLGSKGNDNTVKAVYRTNAQATAEPDKTTREKKTKTYTWGIKILKVGENNSALSNVEFKLSNDEGKIFKFIKTDDGFYVPSTATSASETLRTDSGGRIKINGLKSDIYSLTEVKTKSGYILLKNPVEIVIDGDNTNGSATATVNGKDAVLSSDTAGSETSTTAFVEVKIVNTAGFILPSTGGAGTTMFTIIGITVISISAALLIILRRKAKAAK